MAMVDDVGVDVEAVRSTCADGECRPGRRSTSRELLSSCIGEWTIVVSFCRTVDVTTCDMGQQRNKGEVGKAEGIYNMGERFWRNNKWGDTVPSK